MKNRPFLSRHSQIIAALIGLIGVVIALIVTNWPRPCIEREGVYEKEHSTIGLYKCIAGGDCNIDNNETAVWLGVSAEPTADLKSIKITVYQKMAETKGNNTAFEYVAEPIIFTPPNCDKILSLKGKVDFYHHLDGRKNDFKTDVFCNLMPAIEASADTNKADLGVSAVRAMLDTKSNNDGPGIGMELVFKIAYRYIECVPQTK